MKVGNRITEMSAYIPIEPVEILASRLGISEDRIVKMDANENPYGPSPRVAGVLAKNKYMNIYPDPESRELRENLSQVYDVPLQNILAGSGADELIDLLTRVILEPTDTVINCVPTFGMYGFDTALNYGRCIDIPRNPDFSLNLEAIRNAVEKQKAAMIFVCSPNNPDGRLATTEEINTLLSLPTLIVLDEAYVEFTQKDLDLGRHQSLIRQVKDRDNLVVLRTFSKWAGLAGLRVGFGAFPASLMPSLWKAKQPYNVSVAAGCAAIASLADRQYLASNVARLQAERSRLFGKLQGFSKLIPYPSSSNFILCKSLDRSAALIKKDLASRGIFIRHYDNKLLENFIRISVGKPEDTDTLILNLKEIL